MGRLTWDVLRLVAWHWTWAWRHLVPDGKRREWAGIAAAMSASTLHVRQWAEGSDGPDLPAWVPCRACGGEPCDWDPMHQAQVDRRLAELAEQAARRNAK
jgi:hypothetical protein